MWVRGTLSTERRLVGDQLRAQEQTHPHGSSWSSARLCRWQPDCDGQNGLNKPLWVLWSCILRAR